MADFLLLAKVLLYTAAVVGGVTVAVTVGLTVGNFRGGCILYAPIVENADPKYQWLLKYTSNSNCHFPLGIGIGSMLYGAIYGIYCAVTLFGRNRSGKEMVVLPSLLLNVTLAFLTLIAGCMVSVGYSTFCAHVKEKMFYGLDFGTCNYWQNSQGYKDSENDGMPFATYMTVAQIAVWSLFGVWVILTGLTGLRMRLNAQEGRPASMPSLPWKGKGKGNEELTSPVV